MASWYIDTSALLKWYLPEAGAQEFTAFMKRTEHALISRLTILEVRCVLARYRRSGRLTEAAEESVHHAFTQDIGHGHLDVRPMSDSMFIKAFDLLQLRSIPLRALDALHLAAAHAAAVHGVATADRVMAEAARTSLIDVEFFGAASA